MRRITKFWLTSLFLVIGIALIYVIYQQFPITTVLETFRDATPFAVLLFILVSLTIMTMHALRWNIVLKTAEVHVPFYKVWLYKVIGFGISFITPFAKVGGEPLRAAMLAKHDCPFDKAMSTVVIDKTIDLSTTGVMFSLAVLIAITHIALPSNMKLMLLIIAIIFAAIIGHLYYQLINNNRMIIRIFNFFRLHKVKRLKKLEAILVDFDNRIVDFHKKQTKSFYKSLALSVGAWLLMFLEYKSVLWIFGYNLGLLELFVIITIMGAAYVFPIPLALGIFEFGQAQTFSLLGLKAAAGIGLSLLIRARDLTWTIIAIILMIIFGHRLREISFTAKQQRKLTDKL